MAFKTRISIICLSAAHLVALYSIASVGRGEHRGTGQQCQLDGVANGALSSREARQPWQMECRAGRVSRAQDSKVGKMNQVQSGRRSWGFALWCCGGRLWHGA